MTTRIQDKATITDDGRWVTIPFIRDSNGDRPAIPLEALLPAIPKDLSNPRKVQKP